MKKYMFYLLAISVFYAQLAWAWDSHESAFQGHTDMTLEHVVNIGGDQVDHHANQSDHCDHGLSHLTTLVTLENTFPHTKVTRERCYVGDSLASQALAPPFRPPIL